MDIGPRTAAQWVTELRFDDIPAPVVQRAQDLLLDTLAVAAAGVITPAATIAYDTAAALFSAGDAADAVPLAFDGRPVSTAGAIYALATRLDNLDAHDGYQPAKGHAGVVLVPALLACAAGGGEPPPGRAALCALVAGYEIASRAGTALHATACDYHSSGAWNALGVAALVGRLRGLDPTTLERAFGIAEYHAPRAPMMREIDAPSMLHDSSGWGGLAGAAAIELALRDFSASPSALTGRAEFWSDLGQRWLVAEQYVKPHPVCYWAQPAINAALQLRRQKGFDPKRIRSVSIATFHEASRLARGLPATTEIAQYSLCFPVAAALLRGAVGPEEVAGDGLENPEVARLLERIEVVERDEYNARFPDQRLADVTVTLEDGTRFASDPTEPRGVPGDPMDRTAIVEKFRRYATPWIGAERTDTIERAVLALERPDVGVDSLLQAVAAT